MALHVTSEVMTCRLRAFPSFGVQAHGLRKDKSRTNAFTSSSSNVAHAPGAGER